MKKRIKISIVGAAGKMGSQIALQVLNSEIFELVGAIEAKGSQSLGKDIASIIGIDKTGVTITEDSLGCVLNSDAIIDFSSPNSTVAICELTAQARKVHVIGTTGFSKRQEDQILAASRHATIIKSGNMSLGINALLGSVEKLSGALDDSWDIEISDMHHKHKVDSPSGTALDLAEAVASGRGVDLESVKDIARNGNALERKEGDIGIVSLRGGSVIGDHSVIFAGDGERLVVSHFAENRNIFVKGALRSAQWGIDKGPGLFSTKDVLGFNKL